MAGESLSQGTVLAVQTAAGPPAVYTAVGGVQGVQVPGIQRDDIEVTALDSTAREYIADLPDTGENSFTLFIRKGAAAGEFEAGQKALEDLATSGAVSSFRITLPSAVLGAVSYTCAGYVKTFSITAETRQAITASVTIRWTGSAVKA